MMLWSLLSIFIIVAVVSWATHPSTSSAEGFAVWSGIGSSESLCLREGVVKWLPHNKPIKVCGSMAYVRMESYDSTLGCLLDITDTRGGRLRTYFKGMEPVTFGDHTYALVSDVLGECEIRVTKAQSVK